MVCSAPVALDVVNVVSESSGQNGFQIGGELEQAQQLLEQAILNCLKFVRLRLGRDGKVLWDFPATWFQTQASMHAENPLVQKGK